MLRCHASDYGPGGILTSTGLGMVVEDGEQKLQANDQIYLVELARRADFANGSQLHPDYSDGRRHGDCLRQRNFVCTDPWRACGLQVDQAGHLANWMISGRMVPGMGGIMDLVPCAKCVIVAMQRTANDKPKIVRQCDLSFTSICPADLLMTELSVIVFPKGPATLQETGPRITVAEVVGSTVAELVTPDHVSEMQVYG